MSNVTIRVHARGTGSYIITSPDGLTNLIEVTPTGVNILGSPYSPGGGVSAPVGRVPYGDGEGDPLVTDAAFVFDHGSETLFAPRVEASIDLRLRGGTLHLMRLTGTPTADRIFTLPDVADDTVVMEQADQYIENKRLAGTGMRVQAFGTTDHGLCRGMSVDACGVDQRAPGANGLSVVFPFVGNNDNVVSPRRVDMGGIIATMSSAADENERGHIGLCASLEGTLREVLRASLPSASALYTCGVNVIGADANNNATITGLGKANAGVDIRPLTTGSVRLRDAADTETLVGMESLAGVSRLVVSGGVDLGVAPEINKVMGQVEIQTGSQALTVLNSLVKSTSVVQCVLQSSDALLTQLLNVIPGDGSFVVTGNGVAGTNVKVGFIVFNPAA